MTAGFLILLSTPSSGQSDSATISLDDYGFLIKWAGFGRHADTALLPSLNKQLDHCLNEVEDWEEAYDVSREQMAIKDSIIGIRDRKITTLTDQKEKLRKRNTALKIGAGGLAVLAGWLAIKP